MKKLVTILSGIPGSGKSSYAAEMIVTGEGFIEVYSADKYFIQADGAYLFNKDRLDEAHRYCLSNFAVDVAWEAFETDSWHLIVDNTNTTALEIAPYAALALAFGWGLELVTFKCAPELGAARNVHGVGLPTCKAMARRLDSRKLPERWARYERFITSEQEE